MPVLPANDPLGILSKNKQAASADPLGILKKNDGQPLETGGQGQPASTSPTQSQSQSSVPEAEDQPEPDYINLSKQANQLLIPTYKAEPIMMGGGMMGMGAAPSFQENQQYKVDPEKEKQSKALKDQIKAAGYNPDKLAKDVEGINNAFLKNDMFSNQQLLSDYKKNPQLYERKIATAKWQSELYNSLKGTVNSQDYNKAIQSLNNIALPNLDYNTKRSNVNDIVRIVKNSGIDKDKSDAILSNLFTDLSDVYTSTPIPKNDELYGKGLNDYQISAYHALQDINPSQAVRYKSALLDDKNIGDSYTAQFDKENSLKRLDEAGISMKKNWAVEQINKYSKEYNDLYKSAEDGTASPTELNRLTQLESIIKPYRNAYQVANEAENTLHQKYPNVISEEANSYAKDLIGQKGILGETGEFISSRFMNLSKASFSAGQSLYDILATPFLTDEKRDVEQAKALGYESLYANRFHQTEDKAETIYEKKTLNPFLQNEVDKIKNDESLTYEQKINKTHNLLIGEPVSEWKTERLAEPKSNLSIKSLLYGVTDMAVNLIPFFALEGLSGGGFSAALTAGVLTGFHENYVHALERGSTNPYSDAAVSTAIYAAAMAVGDAPGKIRAAIGNTSPIAKILSKLDDKGIANILKSGNESTALRLLKKTYNIGANVVESTVKGIPSAAGFTASMSAGKMINDAVLNDVKSPGEYVNDYVNNTLHFIPFNAFMGIGGKMMRGEFTESPSTTLTKNALITAAAEPNLHLNIVDEKLKDGSYTPEQAGQIKNNIIKANTILQSTPMLDVKGKDLNDSNKRELLYLKMQESDAVAMLGKDIPDELKDNINKKLEKVRSKISSIYKGEYIPEEVKIAKKAAEEVSKSKEKIPEPDLSNISELIPQEDINTAQSIMDRVNNNEAINIDDIEKGRTILYKTLAAHPEAAHLIEPLIKKIESHENLTKTETVQTVEREPIEGTLAAKQKIQIKPALEQSEGSTATVALADGTTHTGNLRIKDGNYVLEVEGQEPIVIGEKQITDRDLKIPEGESPVELDENGNVKSATFETKDGHKVTITDPEKALDLGIQLSLETVGEIPDEAFDRVYEDVIKEDKIEVPIEKPKVEKKAEPEAEVPEQKEEKLSPEETDIEKKRQNELSNFDENITNKGRLISDAGEVETFMNADGEWVVSTSLPKDKNKPWERTRNETLSGEFKTKEDALEFAKSVIDKLKEKTNAKYDAERQALKEKQKAEIPKEGQKEQKKKKKIEEFKKKHLKQQEQGEQTGEEILKELENKGTKSSDEKSLNELAEKNKGNKIKRKIIEQARKAIKTLKSIFPNMEIHLHDNEQDYNDVMGKVKGKKSSGGNFAITKNADGTYSGRIDINLNKAKKTTIAHEVTHAILFKAFGDNQEVFQSFRDKISNILGSATEKGLKEFADSPFYKAQGVTAEEYLSELSGLLSSKTINPLTLSKIASAINEFVSKLTGGKFIPFENVNDAKDVVEFFDKVSSAIKKGNDLTNLSKEKILETPEQKKNIIKSRMQQWGAFEKLGFEETEEFRKLVESGHIIKDYDLSNVAGMPVFIINPDNMLVGSVKLGDKIIGEGKGGVHFVSDTGDVWAFSDTARGKINAKKMAEFVNNQLKKNGVAHIILSRGDLGKLFSSHAGARGAMRVLEALVEKKIVSKMDFRNALKDVSMMKDIEGAKEELEDLIKQKDRAIKNEKSFDSKKEERINDLQTNLEAAANRKYNINFTGIKLETIHNDVESQFFNKSDNTFSNRGTFVTDIIEHLAKNGEFSKEQISKLRQYLNSKELPASTERKTGNIDFSLKSIKDAVGLLFSDEATVGGQNSDAYALIKVENPKFPVEMVKGEHESYGAHLRQIVDNIPLDIFLKENTNLQKEDLIINKKNEVIGIRPRLLLLSEKNHIADVVNNDKNEPTVANKLGSNTIGLAEGIIKQKSDFPEQNIKSKSQLEEEKGLPLTDETKRYEQQPKSTEYAQGREGLPKPITAGEAGIGKERPYNAESYSNPDGTPQYAIKRSDRDGGKRLDISVNGTPSKAKAVYTQSEQLKSAVNNYRNAYTDKNLIELDDANLFHKLITKAKSINEFGASVHVYEPEEYAKMRLFITPDGKAGVALKPDGDLVSGFSHQEEDKPRRIAQLLGLAIKEGAIKADSFDTVLPQYYLDFGLIPVAQDKWNEEHKPEKWDKKVFKRWNNGEPDVIYYVYKGGDRATISERAGDFGSWKDLKKDVPYAEWDDAVKIQEQKIKENDTENITGLPSKVGGGKEPIPTESKQGAGTQETGTGGVLQTQGTEGEGAGVGQQVGEVKVPEQKGVDVGEAKTTIVSKSQKVQDEKLNDMKDIVKDLVDEGKSLDEITKEVTGDLGDSSQATKDLISQAHEELTTEPKKIVSGASHEALTKTAERLGIDLPQRGKGTTPEQQQQLGQDFISAGVDPQDIANDFIKSGKKKVSADELAVATAHSVDLEKIAQDAMDKYGRDSKQCEDALTEMQMWRDEILKPMGTIFHELGQGLQVGTDINTGSYIAMEGAVKEQTGKDLTPEQEKKVTDISDKSKKAEEDLQNTKDKLTEHIDNAITEEEKTKKQDLNTKIKNIVAKVKKAKLPAFLSKVKRGGIETKSQMTEEQKEVEALSNAVIKMENLLNKGVESSQAIKQAVEGLVQIHGEESRAEIEDGFRDYYENKGWEEEEETPEQKKANSNIKRLEKELEDLRQGKEKGKPVKREVTDKEKGLKKQIQDEKDFLTYNRLVTDLQGKKDNNFTMEQVKGIWQYAKKEYLDKGTEDFDDMFNGVATDLGLTPDQVRNAISQPKGAKAITDEMYRNKRIRDNAVQHAKDYVASVNNPNALKFLKAIPSFFFALRTFGHGTVGFITHAGMDIFNPNTWKMYFPHFLKQFQYAYGSTAKYEAAMADLVRDPDFIKWKNAGLAIDPKTSYTEYEGLKKMFGKLGMAGDRGFNALKVYRLAKAKAEYNKLSNTEKADPKMAQYIAEYINRSTGTTDVQVPGFLNTTLFAPKLIASQFERITTQPIKALATLSKGSKASPAERAAAKIVVKNCASVIATYAGALAANGAMLALAGSSQTVNYTDPSKKDWLRFKMGDKQLDVSSGIIPAMNFIGSILAYSATSKSKKKDIQDAGTAFLLGKVSPLASTIKDVLYQEDFHGDIMPFSNKQPTPGHHKLTWKEYIAKSQAPIPIAEAMTDFYKSSEEKGMKPAQINDYLNAAFMGVTSGFTGAKLKEDISASPAQLSISKEDDSKQMEALTKKGLKVPELGNKNSYKVDSPDGVMTTDEYNKFAPLVIKYRDEEIAKIDSHTYEIKEKHKGHIKVKGSQLSQDDYQTKINEIHDKAVTKAKEELGLIKKKKTRRTVSEID